MNQDDAYFVKHGSIVRKIWGNSDTVLVVFAGAAAEFALNKAVDWLYFTGRLPADPIGRLFSTAKFARSIVFAKKEDALRTIETINQIHAALEKKRGYVIPDWSYRDVLYMLIQYSIASWELLHEKLSEPEKEELYDVFLRMGNAMHLKDLPSNFKDWKISREKHLNENLENTELSRDLFLQYKNHLGPVRYYLLQEIQKKIIPVQVKDLLNLHGFSTAGVLIPPYKTSRRFRLDGIIRKIIMPPKYLKQVESLNISPD